MEPIFNKRIIELNDLPIDENGECIIYWMQRSQRIHNNLAFRFASELANKLSKPLLIYFGLFTNYPLGSERVFRFMLEGLKEVSLECDRLGIPFIIIKENPANGILNIAKKLKACAIIVDEDYIRTGRNWRIAAASKLSMSFVQVDSDTVVPVRNSDKEEWGAYTIRPKILKALPDYFIKTEDILPKKKLKLELDNSINLADCDINQLAAAYKYSQSVKSVSGVTGGYSKALSQMNYFIDNNLDNYSSLHNEIGNDVTSHISPYLHFGQISSSEAALMVHKSDKNPNSINAFIEQIIVRRELAINYCFYNYAYDTISAAPNWAALTLDNHRNDPRPEIYSLEELESSQTHDELWNTAQLELKTYGKIHNYMRMVWAKKILEWSASPEQALQYAIYLNDKYALDGRDPNGYANIAWCIFGKHDRAFAERQVFGKVRYMSTDSTKRKTDWKQYIKRVTGNSAI